MVHTEQERCTNNWTSGLEKGIIFSKECNEGEFDFTTGIWWIASLKICYRVRQLNMCREELSVDP
jgi:hypothetical protein